jgi:hypothetical protein
VKPDQIDKRIVLVFTLLLWLVTAWLLYPLVSLDRVDPSNVKEYLYRTAIGLTLMIVFFGKTLFDLIYPWVVGRKIPLVNVVFLTLYALALTGGIVFLLLRMVLLLVKNRQGSGGVLF